jgi:AraC-like DNA-binding protein
MSGDTLSDVLRAVRLRGAVFYYIDGSSPWVAEAPPARLERGDVILFPQGDPHVMSSAPGLRPPRGSDKRQVYYAPRPQQLPYSLSLRGSEVSTARLDGGGRDRATIVCGFLGLDTRPFNPLLAALPRVLHVPGTTLGPDSWVASFLRSAVVESSQRRHGGEAVLERMSELLFVEVLRRYVDALPAGQTGWLAGMRDPPVGRVLALLHQKPDAPWTLERLANEAAMSRSTLHERFVHFIGQPPMQYLAQWRMQLAATLLRDTKGKLIDVALGVGYESEAAFSRAFKRAVGVAPSAWRAGHRPFAAAAVADAQTA